MLTQHLRDVVY